jgi:uncharacterized protein (TIGR03067 family)
MKRRILTTCLVAFTCIMVSSLVMADDSKQKAIKKDRTTIKGTWQIVGLVINGNEGKAEDVKKLTVVNGSDGTWAVYSEGKMVSKGTSTIDPTKNPKTLDFVVTEGGGEGNEYLGIYQLGKHKRKMCFRAPGKERPTDFKSLAGSDMILVKFERADNDDSSQK